MRALAVLFVMVLLNSGCAHRAPSTDAVGDVGAQPSASSTPSRGKRSDAKSSYLVPASEGRGTVASVQTLLRFVVLDYGLQPLPPVDQRLGVYRSGQKVGELKVTGPALNSTIVADLIAGEAKAGDEVSP